MSESAEISHGKAYALLGMVTLGWAANWPIMKWGLGPSSILAFVSILAGVALVTLADVKARGEARTASK